MSRDASSVTGCAAGSRRSIRAISRAASASATAEGAMRVAFSADHAGAALKGELVRRLAATGVPHEWIDLGGDGSDPNDDYPDFAQSLGLAIQAGRADRGI